MFSNGGTCGSGGGGVREAADGNGDGGAGETENCLRDSSQLSTSSGRIPNTPEILSALISINPLDTYMSQQNANSTDDVDNCSNASSNLGSPASPPNQRNMRTQLIKEDLKMRLQERRMRNLEDTSQQKRLNAAAAVAVAVAGHHQPLETRYSSSGCDESSMDTEEDDGNLSNCDTNGVGNELTPEDEERRKRRRERNKLAAMKCRQKKRERTDRLEHESVNLENQNQKMKSNIQELEGELRNLKTILQTHKPSCVNPSPEPTPVDDPVQPPSFLTNESVNSNITNQQHQQPQSQPQPSSRVSSSVSLPFTQLDVPDFFLTAASEDFFTENVARLPRHGFLFG